MGRCNKVSYYSANDARDHVKEFTAGKSKDRKRTPYKCGMCGNWHITSKSKSQSKRINKHLKEIHRRLNIISKLKDVNTLENLNKLAEDWMVFDENTYSVTCSIFKEKRIVKIRRK